MEVQPPVYPLSREAFKRALITGHGRALIHAEHFDAAEYRDEILEAATTCLVDDAQVDGYREWWLAQVCKAAGLTDTIIELPPGGSGNDRSQRAALLKEFIKAGHKLALPKLYDMCCFDHNGSYEIFGCEQLIEVDGKQGLIFVARRLGEKLGQDPDYWITNWELTFFDDLYNEGSAKAILSEAAPDDANIQLYLEAVRSFEIAEETRRNTEEKAIESVASILQSIKASTKREMRLRWWGNRATFEDRTEVAKLLKTEFSSMILTNVLVCLSGKGLPTFDETLLGLAFHEDDEVRFYATRVFSHHDEPKVRSAGLALLNNGDLTAGTEMLQLSARGGDSEAILSALAESLPCENNHGFLSNLIQLLEKNSAILEPQIPLYIYEFSPCMLCRERAVEILIGWRSCPQWLLDESAKDASSDIRLLAESYRSADS